MSSGMIGMDTADVRVLANNIRTQADRINSVVSNVDGIVHQLIGAWSGQDATEFAGWWQQKHRPALVSVEQLISGLAQSAENRAHDQDVVSSASGTGGGGSSSAHTGGVGVATGVIATGAFLSGVVGTAESQNGSTDQLKYMAATGEKDQDEWCASFVTWTLKQNGYTTIPPDPANVQSWLTAAENHQDGLSITTNPQPGDLVVYEYGGTPGHIGIVTQNYGNGTFQAISGNFGGQVAYTNPGDAYEKMQPPYGQYGGQEVTPIFISVNKG